MAIENLFKKSLAAIQVCPQTHKKKRKKRELLERGIIKPRKKKLESQRNSGVLF